MKTQIMDFSEAERNGFILAYIDFWVHEGSTRSRDELRMAAKNLLKGCRQHFRTGVTRIKKIGGVIPIMQSILFQKKAYALLEQPDTQAFQKHAQELIRMFPKIKPWLSWWMRDDHAAMLFTSERTMDPVLWNSLPESTNAEEAMHHKIYSAVGRDHNLVSGINGLEAFARHFEQLVTGAAGK